MGSESASRARGGFHEIWSRRIKTCIPVSTYTLIEITDLRASESLTFLAIFCMRLAMDLTNRTNDFRSRYLFR
jgi:hypothetical protein